MIGQRDGKKTKIPTVLFNINISKKTLMLFYTHDNWLELHKEEETRGKEIEKAKLFFSHHRHHPQFFG